MANNGHARVYRYEELRKATKNFSTELGHGAFGTVYLGTLDDGKKVAVKVLKDDNKFVLEEFKNEVALFSNLYHENLAVLYGYADDNNEKLLLVYEYMHNDTVACHLHRDQTPPTSSHLEWAVRIQIALQTAEALAFLHSLENPVFHRDVKTTNILLDQTFQAKVADLGLCRALVAGNKYTFTTARGTNGYMAPEYVHSYNLSDKADVYSFGVVLLELVSGLKALDEERDLKDIFLYQMVKNEGFKIEEFVDSNINFKSNYDQVDGVFKLAVKCLKFESVMRPSMLMVHKDLVSISRNEVNLPEDYEEILSQAVTPVEYSSKYDLYSLLCDHPILIDGGMMTFSLERLTGAKCYTLSARNLVIRSGFDPSNWKWKQLSESRFPEVAELIKIHWLLVTGKLDCRVLSRRTNYAAYLIFKIVDGSKGLSSSNETYSEVIFRGHKTEHKGCLNPPDSNRNSDVGRTPHPRPDGWMEMELGDFLSGDGDEGEVEMSLQNFSFIWRKRGLVIEGIEVRPSLRSLRRFSKIFMSKIHK